MDDIKDTIIDRIADKVAAIELQVKAEEAQKKSQPERPKKRVLVSILAVSMLIVAASLSWGQSEKIAGNHSYQVLQQLKEENNRLVAAKVATDRLMDSFERVKIMVEPVNCDYLTLNLGDGTYCTQGPI